MKLIPEACSSAFTWLYSRIPVASFGSDCSSSASAARKQTSAAKLTRSSEVREGAEFLCPTRQLLPVGELHPPPSF